MKTDLTIKVLSKSDIPNIVSDLKKHNWPKSKSIFENYLAEQIKGERILWFACINNEIVGYITLKKQSNYEPFRIQNIPVIMDLNVVPAYRKKGIATNLLLIAEQEAKKQNNIVGLGVGLYSGYGGAQKLYIKKGYLPDGLGITYNDKPVDYGQQVCLDDNLILWFVRKIIS